MAGESGAGSGFHHHHHQQQGVLFKSGGAMSSSGSNSGSPGCQLMIPMGNNNNNYYRNPGGSLNLSGGDGGAGRVIFSSGGGSQNSLDSTSTLPIDSGAGLKHDTGLAVEWSIDEQYKLEEGLAKFSKEPTIMQYIKIAALLRDKTVRDVALRCSWMMRKRRKQDDQTSAKKIKSRKEKFVESSLKNNISSASSVNAATYALPRNQYDHSGCTLSGALSGATRNLLEENNQAFGQISANLTTLKLQQNIELFLRTRNNLTTILNDMSNMPGIMSRMPPLPVFLNDELASSIFPCSSQPMIFSSSSAVPLKPESGC
ncbi:uncharacterized protein LOC127263329 [Andrographis paniculata]|uniref:uncharacterized protein LOC127263329 n=1 Tax=Andrographis paniculata TaxID=175694 RepID=UPI0021E70B1E|nr:uncharacterized protein LOC127263329 [Andrographis paniculata]